MFKNIGTTELLIIAGVALFFFGGKKIPELVQSIGKSIREFRTSLEKED